MTAISELAAFLGPRLAERAAGEADEMRALGLVGRVPAEDELVMVRLMQMVTDDDLMPELDRHRSLYQIAVNHGFSGHPTFKSAWRIANTG